MVMPVPSQGNRTVHANNMEETGYNANIPIDLHHTHSNKEIISPHIGHLHLVPLL